MTLELINPEDLATPASYTHVIVAIGSRLVFVAGQVADDAQGNLVGPATWLPKPARHSPTWHARSVPPERPRSR
jgi:hypothetical protein